MMSCSTQETLRRKKLDLLLKTYDGFLNNSSNEITQRIVAKLIHHSYLRYSMKNTITDSNLLTRDRAEKLFDYVYKSDINVIDFFLNEIKEIFPHIYRMIDSSNKGMTQISYFFFLLFLLIV